MQKTSHGAKLAAKLFLSAGAPLLFALFLASSSIFGDANSISVGMILGLMLVVPAGCLCVLALLALSTTPPHSSAVSGAQLELTLFHGHLDGTKQDVREMRSISVVAQRDKFFK